MICCVPESSLRNSRRARSSKSMVQSFAGSGLAFEITPLLQIVETPALARMFESVESDVGVFDFVEMSLEGLTDVEALRTAGEPGQLVEARFHFVGDTDCQHENPRSTNHICMTN